MTATAKASARLQRERPRRQTLGAAIGAKAAALAFQEFGNRPRTKAEGRRDGSNAYARALNDVIRQSPELAHRLDDAHGVALAAVEEEGFLVGYYAGLAATAGRR